MKTILGVIFVMIVLVAIGWLLLDPVTMTFRRIGAMEIVFIAAMAIAGFVGLQAIDR